MGKIKCLFLFSCTGEYEIETENVVSTVKD